MSFCGRCGTGFEYFDLACSNCGAPPEPVAVAVAEPTPYEEPFEPEPYEEPYEPEPSPEPEAVGPPAEPGWFFSGPAEPEPVEDVPAVEAPVPEEPALLPGWDAEPDWGDPVQDWVHEPELRRGGTGAVVGDLVVLLLTAAGACAVGFELRSSLLSFGDWHYGGWIGRSTDTTTDALLLSAPLVLAALAATFTRIPGAGTIVAGLGLVAMYTAGGLEAERSWYAGLLVAGFALADLVLLTARRTRGVLVSLGAVVLAGAGVVAWHLGGALGNHPDLEHWGNRTLAEFYVLPVGLVLVTGLVGTLLGRTIHRP